MVSWLIHFWNKDFHMSHKTQFVFDPSEDVFLKSLGTFIVLSGYTGKEQPKDTTNLDDTILLQQLQKLGYYIT